jgi:lipid II:glycine glycyltransferase (peptidoglycan interpeptide bridge formation enzyme)
MTTAIKTIDRTEWQQIAPSFLDYNYRQLWDFGTTCAKRLNATSEHVAVQDNQEILGLADVRIKKIPVLGSGIAYINGGPLVRKNNSDDYDRLRACLHALVSEYAEKQGLLLRIKPPLGPESWNDQQNSAFEVSDFSTSQTIKPYRTFLLDLNRTLEELRKNLSQKWRNNLKRAEAGIQPIQSDRSVESFTRFSGLYKMFRKKKQFDVDLDPEFYIDVQRLLPECERMRVALCEQEGILISGHVSNLLGDMAVNLFRANTKAALSSRVSYLIQWNGICYAHEQGCRWYDLGGIDPEGNPGVYSFKKGIGGKDVTAPGPFECYPDGFKRMLVSGCEKVYTTLRNLRTH